MGQSYRARQARWNPPRVLEVPGEERPVGPPRVPEPLSERLCVGTRGCGPGGPAGGPAWALSSGEAGITFAREPGPTPGPPPLTAFRAMSLPTQCRADSGSDVFKN